MDEFLSYPNLASGWESVEDQYRPKLQEAFNSLKERISIGNMPNWLGFLFANMLQWLINLLKKGTHNNLFAQNKGCQERKVLL